MATIAKTQGKSPPGRRRKKFLPFKLRVGSLGAKIEELNDRNFGQNSGIDWVSRNSGGSGTARGPHSGPRPGVENSAGLALGFLRGPGVRGRKVAIYGLEFFPIWSKMSTPSPF